MTITKKVALEIAHHEAVIRQAYKDSIGVWTWSVGLTNNTGHIVERYIDNPAPMKKCIDVWLWAMEKYAEDVREAFDKPLNEHQFAGALSFHWNTGAINRASWVKKWNEGDEAGAYRDFMNWRKPEEIIPRRQAERDLFFKGIWKGRGKITEYTRLKPNHTPDWKSAKRVDISPLLKGLK